MIGINKKPLIISFWLLLIAAVIPAAMYVYILANATYPGRETVLEIAKLLFYYFAPSVLLCVHMKLQQSGKTDFLFPFAFMVLLATHTMFWISCMRNLFSTLVPLAIFWGPVLLLTTVILVEYFQMIKPIVSLVILFILLAIGIFFLAQSVQDLIFCDIPIFAYLFPLTMVLSPCLVFVACIIYTFLRIKYINALKCATREEKEQMLRMLKMQRNERKFSARQYERRKEEILKYKD